MFKRLRNAVCAVALVAVTLGLAVPLLAASAPQQAPAPASPEALLTDFERVRIDPAEATARVRQTGRLTIQTATKSFDLALVPNDLRAPSYRAQAIGENGIVEAIEPGPVKTYRGKVRELPGAEARFTIEDDGITGLVLADDVWYYVEPERHFSKSAEPASYIVYSSLDLRNDSLGKCGTTLAEVVGTPETPAPVPEGVLQKQAVQPVIELATDADFEYFQSKGGARAANDEILSIVNQVEGVYRKQLGLVFRVTFQNVWTSREDPYTSDDALETLVQFRGYWNSNFQTVERDLAHLWTGRDFFDNTLGIAYTGVACSSAFASYGLSQEIASGPGKFILSAHEMGHNLSALHPDQQEPPVQACDNTIMQSFVGSGFTFCKYSKNQVANWLLTHSNCLKNNHEPIAVAATAEFAGQGDAVPLFAVGSTDIDGDALSYQWHQTQGPSVSIANATSAMASFSVPSLAQATSVAFEVTVTDARGGSSVAAVDVTLLPETLAGVTITSPGAAPIKAGKKVKIAWTPDAGLTGTLLVEASADGGATWETIATGVSATAKKVKWKTTRQQKTGGAIVRITSEADTRAVSYSPAFALQ